MKSAVITFPGSNCDRDMRVTLQALELHPVALWHEDTQLPDGLDLIVLPGGFSYGDYLRCGAMAARAPVMTAVREFAARGGLVLGVCNGFQILTEAGLLPGALLRNQGQRFICAQVTLRVESTRSPFLRGFAPGACLTLPIAHAEGRYVADDETLRMLTDHGQIALRYCDPAGKLTPSGNPNGSTQHIAGITNRTGNILGLMPHPERRAEADLGGEDGAPFFRALLETWPA